MAITTRTIVDNPHILEMIISGSSSGDSYTLDVSGLDDAIEIDGVRKNRLNILVDYSLDPSCEMQIDFSTNSSGSFEGIESGRSLEISGLILGPSSTSSNLILEYDSQNYSSGISIVDETDNGRDGTIVGSPTHDGNFFSFSNDYIITPNLNSEITASSESHTLEVWVYPTDNGVVAMYAGQTDPFSSYHHSAIEIVSGQLEVGLWNGTTISSTGPIGAVTLNQWHQLVLTYNGSVCKGYLDGVYKGQVSVTWDSPMDDSRPGFHIALGASDITNQGDGTYFDGKFGLMKIYDGALSDSEVEDKYNETSAYLNTPITKTSLDGVALSVSQTSTSGLGHSATFDITSSGGTIIKVVVNNEGDNYSDGDTITISAADLTALGTFGTVTNDLIINVTTGSRQWNSYNTGSIFLKNTIVGSNGDLKITFNGGPGNCKIFCKKIEGFRLVSPYYRKVSGRRA